MSPKEIIKQILDNRTKINLTNNMYAQLFGIALQDKQAAQELFREPNRFVQNAFKFVDSNLLIKFIQTYPALESTFLTYIAQEDKQKLEAIFQGIKNATPQAALDGRTHLMVDYNPNVKQPQAKSQQPIVKLPDGSEGTCVTRATRDFSTEKLYSTGASGKREILELDPASKILQAKFFEFTTKLKINPRAGEPIEQILQAMCKFTQSIFPITEGDKFIQYWLQKSPVIPLEKFVEAGVGVCRHQTLLNCFFLSGLQKNGALNSNAEIIHHRQNLGKEAHTWVIIKTESGKLYSLDSTWNNVTCLTDNPGALNKLYRDPTVEKTILERYLATAKPAKLAEQQAHRLFSLKNNKEPKNNFPEGAKHIIQRKF